MKNQTSFLRRFVRQTIVLMGLAGLTFAAGIEWAEAATRDTGGAMPNQLHVLVLFLGTIAFVIHAVVKSQKPARAKKSQRIRR